MVDTIKFSEFADGGDLQNDNITVGLEAAANARFNNPWTFIAPGTTGDRPVPAASMYYRLRLNTTLEVYEYYDPTTATWVQLSGTGTGTVNPGLANDLAYYAATGTAISAINGNSNAVLVTNGSGVPSLSTTLPSGLSIPGATITASTAALTSGSVVAAPVAGIDLTNKTYVDALVAGGVTSITGTTNQVIASSPTGAVTLSLPQDIATGSAFQANTVQYNSNNGLLDSNGNIMLRFNPQATSVNQLQISNGATGVNPALTSFGSDTNIDIGLMSKGTGIVRLNSASTTQPVSFKTGTAIQHETNFNFANTANTRTVTFPDASGTVAFTSDIPAITPAALTRVNDTNVTLTLGGTPATALLQASSITAGWAGTLAVSRGGTNVSSVTIAPIASSFAGWDANSNLSANNFLSAFATTVTAAGNTILTVASAHTQEFTGVTTQTVTLPVASTLAVGTQFYILNNSTGAVTVNSSGGNAVQILAANTSGIFTSILNSGTTAASWNVSYVVDAGGGVTPGTINQLAYYSATGNVVSGLSTANNGVLVTSGSAVPSISSTLPSGLAATNLTLTTPALGTPSAGNLSNCTAFPTAQLSGLGTGVATFLATPSSANLAAAVTNETGSGALVFGTSPAIQTPTVVDSNAVNALAIGTTASAVNYLTVFNRAAGSSPYLQPTGTDTDIGILMSLKGAGIFQIATNATAIPISIFSGTAQQHRTNFSFSNTSATRTVTFPDADGTVLMTGTAINSVPSITFSSTTGIVGTTTNNNAAAGSVGEVMTASNTAGTVVSSGVATNVSSINLTAGDWDVYGNVFGGGTVTSTDLRAWISTTSTTLPTIPGYNEISGSGGSAYGAGAPFFRASLSGTTTVYLGGSTVGTGTLTLYGTITARRVR
jgi:hypothetical protein